MWNSTSAVNQADLSMPNYSTTVNMSTLTTELYSSPIPLGAAPISFAPLIGLVIPATATFASEKVPYIVAMSIVPPPAPANGIESYIVRHLAANKNQPPLAYLCV